MNSCPFVVVVLQCCLSDVKLLYKKTMLHELLYYINNGLFYNFVQFYGYLFYEFFHDIFL